MKLSDYNNALTLGYKPVLSDKDLVNLTECERLWQSVLVARSAAIKTMAAATNARTTYEDAVDIFSRTAQRVIREAVKASNKEMDQPHYGHEELL